MTEDFKTDETNKDGNPYVNPNLDISLGRKGLTTARYIMDIESHDFFQTYMEWKGVSEAEVMRRAVNALTQEEIPS